MTRCHASAVALATLLAASAFAPAQSTAPFADPANLRGERVSPRTGRELPIDGGQGNAALGLQQMLRRLGTRASILNIVAHPDDEDGGMLTFYARGMGARVADLSLTRGEGGQNAMTGDFEDALGLLRTQELLANDRYTGVDQMFGTEVDFGFSKTKSEAFSKWTHERVLYDAVRAIRLYRPLVITSTWIGAPTDGHGQHQASGQIAQEAFLAAGDPKVFPELTAEGILPWQPLRVYARVPRQSISDKGLFDYATNQFVPAEFENYVTGRTSTTPPSVDITVREGTPDALLTYGAANPQDLFGKVKLDTQLSYVQFARIGLGLQKSQVDPGFHTAPAGAFDVPYHLFGSRVCELDKAVVVHDVTGSSEPHASATLHRPSTRNQCVALSATAASPAGPGFFDGIDTSLTGIRDLDPDDLSSDLLADLSQTIAASQKASATPEAITRLLAQALQDDDKLIDQVSHGHRGTATERANALHELRIKRVQLNDALTLALGITMTATTESADVSEQPRVSATLKLTQRDASAPVEYKDIVSVTRLGETEQKPLTLGAGSNSCELNARFLNTPRLPYFHRANLEQPVYQVNSALRNAPEAPPDFSCFVDFTYAGVPLRIGAVAEHDLQPLQFVPPVSVAVTPRLQVLPTGVDSFPLTVTVRPPCPRANDQIDWSAGHTAEHAGCFSPALQTGWKLAEDKTLSGRGDGIWHYTVSITDDQRLHKPAARSGLEASVANTTYSSAFRAVGYGDLPRTNFYTPASLNIVPVDLKLPPADHRRVGYVAGTGDAVPEALTSIGFHVTLLRVADLNPATLAGFDTVVLGVRTYNAHPDLHGPATQALLDFARSGGNVVVQYQTPEFTAADAPYPLSLGANEKVVDETAPVELLKPSDALLATPNRITPADFNGWNEERGHGFMATWDDHYTALTTTHDPGAPQEHVLPQAPQGGGLLTTPLGKGRWTYVAFALYRQLPEAVPGAFRLFVNLLNP